MSAAIAAVLQRWLLLYLRALARIEQGDLTGATADIAAAQHLHPDFVGWVFAQGRLHYVQARSPGRGGPRRGRRWALATTAARRAQLRGGARRDPVAPDAGPEPRRLIRYCRRRD